MRAADDAASANANGSNAAANSECVAATSTALSCCGSHTSADTEVVVDAVEPAAADGVSTARMRTTGAAHASRAAAVMLCAVSMECRVAI